MNRIRRHTRKVAIGIVGGVVVLVGIVMIPYPGPGWLVVFAGLAILATEFEFAARILENLKNKYERWKHWLTRQPLPLQFLVLAFTGLVIVLTIWLLNGFGFLNHFLGLGQDWLSSPFLRT